MLIKDIEPIKDFGIDLLKKQNADEIIDKIIEAPLRSACKILRQKGIKTVMSSANKNNVLQPGEKRKEKEDVKDDWMYCCDTTFEDAGCGYAWIMLDFETLSDENKDMLFALEERNDAQGNHIGERRIWFVHPFMLWNMELCEKIKKDERLEKFEKKSIILSYNNRYPESTIIVRMPVTEQTTADEVEEYFVKFAEVLKEQNKEKEFEDEER